MHFDGVILKKLPCLLLLVSIVILPAGVFAQPPTYLWAKAISGNVESIQRSIVADASGNVYIYGVFFGTVDFDPGPGTYNVTPVPYGCNIYMAKYDVNGNFLWIKNIPITASYGGNSMVLDADGNILIAGFYSGSNIDFDPNSGTAFLSSVSGSTDIYFAKYDAGGNYLWAKSIGSTGTDAASQILTDANGNILLTGTFSGTVDFNPGAGVNSLTASGTSDIFLAKYDANGNYLWAEQLGGSNTEDVRDIAVDLSGNIFLTGTFYTTADFDPGSGTANLVSAGNNDIYFAKYDAAGNYLWAKQMGSTSYDIGSSLQADANGNIYLTGTFNATVDFDPGPGTVNYTAVAGGGSFFGEYDANGNYVWVKPLPLNTANIDILFDNCSSLYISGSYLSGGASSIDLDPGPGTAMVSVPGNLPPPYYNILARYDLNGNYLWGSVFGQSCYCSVSGYKSSLSSDANGYVYFAGIFNAPWFGTSTVDFDPGSGVANLVANSNVDNSFFAKYLCPPVLLPIELVSFYGESTHGINRLHWTTGSEINNDYFELERSNDAVNFYKIALVDGNGSSNQQHNYTTDDLQPMPATNYYRLKQVDFNGQFTYSDVIALENEPAVSITISAPGLFVIYSSSQAIEHVNVYDLNGSLIDHKVINTGTGSLQLDLSDRASGLYFVSLDTNYGTRHFKLVLSH